MFRIPKRWPALLFLLCPFLATAAPSARRHVVAMKSISYDPKILSIAEGESVEWKNVSYTEHSAAAEEEKGFDTGSVKPGKTSPAVPFPHAGIFKYHCRVHGKTMSGKIIVEKARP